MASFIDYGTTVSAGDKPAADWFNASFNSIFSYVGRVPMSELNYHQEDVTISSPTTLTSGKIYRFPSLSVTDTLTFSGGTPGVPTVVIVEGNCTISGTATCDGAGFASGDGDAGGDPAASGVDNLTGAPYMTAGGGAGVGGRRGPQQAGGAAATFTQFTNAPSGVTTAFNVIAGAGGGAGGGNAGGFDGGDGGAGGGAIIFFVKGTFDGTGGVVSADGLVGETATEEGTGGGGGGAGGTIVIIYSDSYTTPTFSFAAGAGGTGNGGAITAGGGGSGGAGQSGSNSTAGAAGVTTEGGDGGAGSIGTAHAFQIPL